MLEHVPAIVGEALKGVRPGLGETVGVKTFADVPETIVVASPAFAHGAPMPADGRALSPPLTWRNVPAGAAELVLLIEDADSPTPEPLVHAIVLGLPGRDGGLRQGAPSRLSWDDPRKSASLCMEEEQNPTVQPAGFCLASGSHAGEPAALGQNSVLAAEYLPPDPPPGHGPHRYVVQVFALDQPIAWAKEPGRGAVVAAIGGHVLAKGVLIGTVERT